MRASAVGAGVKLARLPLDIAVSMLPGDGDGARPAASIAVDRWEATLRQVAGYALRDDELREDAARRRAAADERARALRLREAAERRRAEADERLADRVQTAEEQRSEAEAQALEEREAALTAKAEAQRLRDEATKKKAARRTKR